MNLLKIVYRAAVVFLLFYIQPGFTDDGGEEVSDQEVLFGTEGSYVKTPSGDIYLYPDGEQKSPSKRENTKVLPEKQIATRENNYGSTTSNPYRWYQPPVNRYSAPVPGAHQRYNQYYWSGNPRMVNPYQNYYQYYYYNRPPPRGGSAYYGAFPHFDGNRPQHR